jgi:hypothetical protein
MVRVPMKENVTSLVRRVSKDPHNVDSARMATSKQMVLACPVQMGATVVRGQQTIAPNAKMAFSFQRFIGNARDVMQAAKLAMAFHGNAAAVTTVRCLTLGIENALKK